MRHPSVLPYLGLFALSLILLAVSGDRAVSAEQSAEEAEMTVIPMQQAPEPPSREELRYTRDLVEEIRLARERQITAVDELKKQFLSATDPIRALELQEEIQELKLRGQMELLQIQIRHARMSGREEMAREAEASVEAFQKLLEINARKEAE